MKLSYDISSDTSAIRVDPDSELSESPQSSFMDDGGVVAPEAPSNLADCGVAPEILADLVTKLAYNVPRFTTEWAAQMLCLPLPIVAELLEELRADKLVEVLGESGLFNLQFAITGRGRERAARLLEISGYVGPAPVSLEAYTELLEWQFPHLPQPSPEQVTDAFSDLTLPDYVVQVAGLAIMSRRSLFLHGPAGNGKTTVGHLVHDAVEGELWIPHCIAVEHSIIRIFDLQCHQPVPSDPSWDAARRIDRRWVRVKRPFVVVGGELTLDALDLVYSRSLGYYEAPLHLKANGGTFLLDDFGCQHVEPAKLLNRWIFPLEHQVDYLTLQTGQKLKVPFRQMLVISTNLDLESVMSPAFLRRMGYRLHLDEPSPERYREIFQRYAARYELGVPPDLMQGLLDRYRSDRRPLRACEPRDLIERVRDICRYRGQPLQLNAEILELAWQGYFGNL